MIALATPRLVLRPWTPADVEPFVSLCADPDVMRYIADGSTRDRHDVVSLLERNETAWRTCGWGLFATEQIDTGLFIGFCGLVLPEGTPHSATAPEVLEIGWRLARSHWGQGLATEAAAATLDWAFSSGPDPERVIAIVQTANIASHRVAAKIGMRLDHRLEQGGRLIDRYEMTRARWTSDR